MLSNMKNLIISLSAIFLLGMAGCNKKDTSLEGKKTSLANLKKKASDLQSEIRKLEALKKRRTSFI